MPRITADPNVKKEPRSRLPYEKPRLKAVDLHADEIMGSCQSAPPCGVIVPPGSGPVSGIG